MKKDSNSKPIPYGLSRRKQFINPTLGTIGKILQPVFWNVCVRLLEGNLKIKSKINVSNLIFYNFYLKYMI